MIRGKFNAKRALRGDTVVGTRNEIISGFEPCEDPRMVEGGWLYQAVEDQGINRPHKITFDKDGFQGDIQLEMLYPTARERFILDIKNLFQKFFG